MAFTDGRRSRFRIADSGGVMRDLSAYITEVSGLPGERTLNEVTALGDYRRALQARRGVSAVFTLSGLFDDTAVTGADSVAGRTEIPHRPHTAFEYAPSGFTVGKRALHRKVLGEVLRTTQSQPGEPVSWKATLQVEGVRSTGCKGCG